MYIYIYVVIYLYIFTSLHIYITKYTPTYSLPQIQLIMSDTEQDHDDNYLFSTGVFSPLFGDESNDYPLPTTSTPEPENTNSNIDDDDDTSATSDSEVEDIAPPIITNTQTNTDTNTTIVTTTVTTISTGENKSHHLILKQDVALSKPEANQSRVEKLLYNYYANQPDEYIIIENDEHQIIHKWALYALSNTDVHDEALQQNGIDPNHLRSLINNCRRIVPMEYFTSLNTKKTMLKWINQYAVTEIPEYIPADCIYYYNMSSLLLNSYVSPYDTDSRYISGYSDGYRWLPLRILYHDPAYDKIYTTIIMVHCHGLDYVFSPKLSSHGNSDNQHVICLDANSDQVSDINPYKLTALTNGILFRPLTHLYLGLDDIYSIGSQIGYSKVLAACERTQWKGLFD